jgi:antitoxin (DNA-binding transcriptional repressor) of toxin-antitoxin stability system
MTYEIAVDEAATRLPELVDKATLQGDTIVLLRQGEPVAELKGVKKKQLRLCDLPRLLREGPHLSPEDAEEFARDLEQMRAEMASAPQRDPWES